MRVISRLFSLSWLSAALVLGVGCAQVVTGGGNRDAGGNGNGNGNGNFFLDGGAGNDGNVNDGGGGNDAGNCDPDPRDESIGDACTNAIDLGTLADAAGDVVVVTGNGIPAGRAIWWSFTGADDVDTAGDEFHVDVRFLDNPLNAYEMTVYRGGCDPSNLIADGESDQFDWYTDFPTRSTGCTTGQTPCGEGDCVATDDPTFSRCEDDTAVFYVRIRRAGGAANCDQFTLELSNGLYVAP